MDLQERIKCAKSLRPCWAALVLLISLGLGLSAALTEVKIIPKIRPQQKIKDRYIVVLRLSVPDTKKTITCWWVLKPLNSVCVIRLACCDDDA
jgi:hypothetical protein